MIPHKIAVLVFIRNSRGEQLLLLRARPPNRGAWSPVGGKLETASGESPFECAIRETFEETGHAVTTADLHLFAMISEKSYEGSGHWLLFLFDCKKPLDKAPPEGPEGRFAFHAREALDKLPLPESDRDVLWRLYDAHRGDFVALRADCRPGGPLRPEIEQLTRAAEPPRGAR
ncbi:MAG: NUDIX domain-containing protein [Opitutaceae bacterium]|jgi:8-oxo-dGTP diphosphatase|nr:NUDIX domain-containing protein [Opitutaceae bacterium]